MSTPSNPWTTLESREVYDNPWIRVEEHQVLNPSGGRGIYGKVFFKNRAVGIIPIDDDGYTWLVGQYRYTLDVYSWEVPMGGGPLGESVEDCARRELMEETGLRTASLTHLMDVHMSNSVTDETGHVFVARELVQGETDFEETEDLRIMRLPLGEAIAMACDGRITDCLSVAGLLRLAHDGIA
jgi:8-oxo-dGTP pyrophosphatase MutT (NUDIX family)